MAVDTFLAAPAEPEQREAAAGSVPPPPTRLPMWVTLGAVVYVIAVVVWKMDPGLLFANTTTTGGDTGAHVALAAFMKSSLLPHGHLSGWDPGAYDGFPLYTFYFPVPDVVAAVLGYVIPFNIAFKLATILGSVALPVAAWAFGRLAGLERPVPAVLAVSTLPFLFDQTFTIYGGNLYSTLAGEYSYSLGLSIALVFLGTVIFGLRTGRLRASAVVLLVICVLCHVVAAMFAIVGALVAFVLVGPSKRRAWWLATVLGVSALLVAWWALPFVTEQPYTTNMGWTNVTTWASLLAPVANRWVLALAAVGIVVALARLSRPMLLVMLLGAASAGALVLDPQSKLYNTRFLPLWWLCAYLIAGYAIGQAGVGIARLWRRRGSRADLVGSGRAGPLRLSFVIRKRRASPGWAPGAVGVPLAAVIAAGLVVIPPLVVSPDSPIDLGPLHVRVNNVPAWAQWNYSGYERKDGWPEFHSVIQVMHGISSRYGCGRAMWEYSPDLNRFGTPMSLMLLPYFTGGCIDSMEGLLFESSTTTPYHFLDQAELSAQPSEAVVGLDYGPTDVPLGVKHLQLLGVRYFLASSPTVEKQADADPDLSLIATSGPWHTPYQGQDDATTWKVYLVNGSPIVAPLSARPEVLAGVGAPQGSWLPLAVRWFHNRAAWDQQLVASGPRSWTRISGPAAIAEITRPGGEGVRVAEPPVEVSAISVSSERISFHVDRTGVPVLVKVSYFPAWHAHGAEGPYRAEPDLMVVVPTSSDVTLVYGSTAAGTLGKWATLAGVVMLAALVRRRESLTVP